MPQAAARGLRHGECVALGMVAEARYAAERGLGAPGLPGQLRGWLRRLGLPESAPPLRLSELRRAALHDKKREGQAIRLPFLRRPGEPDFLRLDITDLDILLSYLPGVEA
jgi:3-dehydroquinate synthetase